MRALACLALVLAGCSTDKCKDGSAFVSYTLPSSAQSADSLDVTLTIADGTAQTKSTPRQVGDGTLEIDFSTYPKGMGVTVSLVARANGSPVAEGTGMGTASAGCLALAVALAASTDDLGVADMISDGGEPFDDFAGDVLADISVPPSADLAFEPSTTPSCTTLAPNCGKALSDSCCASPIVSGGTYYRGRDFAVDGLFSSTAAPATVSGFRLDKYEVTVGRFRRFLASGNGTQVSPPAVDAGANPYLAGSGWQASWNGSLAASTAALETALACDTTNGRETWTSSAGAKEDEPINCVTWFEAFAFCAWDGGFIPTEAEWNYAATAGSDQRAYPWSDPAASVTIGCSYADYNAGFGSDNTHCVGGTAGGAQNVGFDTDGDGKFGQSDLGGNVFEWVLDWQAAFPTPCVDCANLVQGAATNRGARGGGLLSNPTTVRTGARGSGNPAGRTITLGIRCARDL